MKEYLASSSSIYDNPAFFDELPFWSAPFGIELLNVVRYSHVHRVLDIGSGAGFPLLELAMRFGCDTQIIGVDPWRNALMQAQQKIVHHALTNIVLTESVAEFLPVTSHSIDLVTSNNGINNVQDRQRVFDECARVLRSGGQFVATMNTAMTMLEFYRHLETVLQEMHLDTAIEAMRAHITKKRPDVAAICSMLESAGLSVRQRTTHVFTYRFADGTALLHHRFIKGAFLPSWVELLPHASVEAVFDRVERNLNNTAEPSGGLTLTIPFVVIDAVKER